jgi:probable HAF family extracellular repeat protein
VDPYRAFRWRADTGFQDLGTLGGDRTYVRFAVNRDGTVIYGASQLANGEWRAFRWTASTGIQDLNTLYAGAIPSGWVLRNAIDCSSDGRYVVGWAQGPGGVVRGFLLDTGVSSNRPPAVPTLIAPAHNARVSSLPTFQLRASDPDGDRVRFEVQVWQGSDVRTFSVPASGFVPSGQVASGTPPQPLPAGTWRWKARTWDERGGVSSWSGERTFQVPPSELNPPTNLQAQAISSTQIRLTWQDNSPDETGFEIQRRHQNATSFATIATVRAGQTSYTDWALAPATTYVYRVRAVDTVQGRVSAWSNEASATTLGDLPAAPSNLQAQALSGSQVLLTWRDNSNNEQGFEIQRAPVSTGVYQTLTRVAANVTSYIDRQGLQPDTEYRYRVRAYNAAGSSDWSNEASVRTLSNIDFSSYRFIKANLHSHTNYSDGGESIEDAWRNCFLKLLAITDHAEQLTLDEWNAIQAFADSPDRLVSDVRILRGFEWTKTCCDDSCWTGFWCSIWSGIGLSRIRGDGHINVFNTQNRVGAYFTSDLTQNDIRDTLDSFYAWLVEADRNERFFSDVPVIAQFNHPTLYEYITRFRDFRLPEGNREQLREIFALMEVGSHCGLGCYHNTEANEGWYRFALNRGWRVAPTNNQDNHVPFTTAKTKPFTGILLPSDIASSPASMLVQQECLRALSKRRTYASEDKNSTILMAARLAGDTGWSYLMGDVITLPSSGFGQLTLAISAKNPEDSPLNTRDYIQRVELIAPRGQIIYQDSFNVRVSEVLFEVRLSEAELRSLPRTDLGEIYIYAKMVQADGDIVLSAPIWIKFIDGQFMYDRRNQPPVEGECDQPVEPFEIKLLEEEPVGLEEEPVGLEEPFPVKGGSSDGHGH